MIWLSGFILKSPVTTCLVLPLSPLTLHTLISLDGFHLCLSLFKQHLIPDLTLNWCNTKETKEHVLME